MNAGSDQIRDLIQKGDFGAVWVPAFQARDLAIALEGRLDQLPAGRRELAEPAIKRLVRTAWLLDAFGDLGNQPTLIISGGVMIATGLICAIWLRQRPR